MITKDRKKNLPEEDNFPSHNPRTKTSWFKMLLNTTSLIGLLIALVHSVHVITSAKVEVQKKKNENETASNLSCQCLFVK